MLQQLFNVCPQTAKLFDLDSRVGLNGSASLCSFPAVLDTSNLRFYLWLGETPLSSFTKTTFLNIADFAEKSGAKEVVLVMAREHQ